MAIDVPSGKLRIALRKFRVDTQVDEEPALASLLVRVAVLMAIPLAFVVLGGGSLTLNDAESRLGIASQDGLAPFGRVFGGWDPTLSPGKVIVGHCWSWIEGGQGSPGVLRWPSVIAAFALVLILSRRMGELLGARAENLLAVCLASCVAMIDRSAWLGNLDLLTGLAVVGAIEGILSRGSGWTAGAWAAFAVAMGGWPALAIVLLPTVVLGRPGSFLSYKLLIPPAAVFAGWSAWAISSLNPEIWAASVAWPLTRPASWMFAGGVFAFGLPWSPLAILAARADVRESWGREARRWISGWAQVAGVVALAGSLIPGLADAARVPAIVALMIAGAGGLDRVIEGRTSAGSRRMVFGFAIASSLAWGLVAIAGGGYLAAAVPYYRGVSFLVMGLGLLSLVLAVNSAFLGNARVSAIAMILVAAGIKLMHSGYFVPETNYRFGQGPWGRAIGQYVPPRWPIYTLHPWRADLAFATEHPVVQLADERLLKVKPGDSPRFLLLQPGEFEHWSESAPKIQLVRTFEDERGAKRVLARTEGKLIRKPHDD